MKAIKIIIALFLLFNTNILCQDNNGWVKIFDKDDFTVQDIKIAPSDPSIIYIVGLYGVYRSEDKGTTWECIEENIPTHLINVDPFDPDIIFTTKGNVLGDLIIKSMDGGVSWTDITPGSSNTIIPFIEIENSEKRSIYVVVSSLTRNLYRSDDFGENWEIVETPSSNRALSISNINPNILYLDIYKSINRGESWDSLEIDYDGNFTEIYSDPNNTEIIYAKIHNKGFYKSIDGGITWIKKDSGITEFTYRTGLVFNPKNTQEIFISTDSLIYRTQNAGESWDIIKSPLKYTYSMAIDIDNAYRLIVGGYPGLYALDLSTTSVKEENKDQIANIFELYQNYPNPFNPTTIIKFNLKMPGNVVIEVFDLLGNCISEIIDENLDVGKHTMVWNGNDNRGNYVASGIYIYRLHTKGYFQSKKMLLIR